MAPLTDGVSAVGVRPANQAVGATGAKPATIHICLGAVRLTVITNGGQAGTGHTDAFDAVAWASAERPWQAADTPATAVHICFVAVQVVVFACRRMASAAIANPTRTVPSRYAVTAFGAGRAWPTAVYVGLAAVSNTV